MIINRIKRSIRARFLVRIIPTIIAILIIFSTIIIRYYLVDVNQRKQKNIETTMELMKVNVSNSIWQFDYDHVERYCQTLQRYESFSYINILSNNEIVYRYTADKYLIFNYSDFHNSKQFITKEIKLEHNNFDLGIMQLALEKEGINSTVKSIILSMTILLVLIIAGITFIILLSSSRLIFRPLKKLGKAFSKASTGDMTVQSEVYGSDEISHLAITFNKMIKNLKTITASRDELNDQIEKRKTVEIELKNRNHYIEVLLMNLPVGIILTSLESNEILYLNNKFLEIHGYEKDELQTMDQLFQIFFPDKSARETVIKQIGQNSLLPDKMYWEDLAITKKNGEKIFTTVTNIPLVEQNLLISTVQNSTPRKEAETKLRKYQEKLEDMIEERTRDLKEKTENYENSQLALSYLMEDTIETREKLELVNKQLEEANKELESFSYSISHDLRSPLRAISGFSTILEEDYSDILDDNGKEFLQIIRNNTQMMSRLINELLEFSRLSRKDIHKSVINMEMMFKNVFKKQLELVPDQKVEYSIGSLPSAEGDPLMIEQVLTNIVSNAIKYSAMEKLSIINIKAEIKGKEVIYKVTDNGVGFNMKYSDKIFGVFQRLHSVEDFEGTGVGLAIVDRILKKHNGRIWVESEIDKGTTFYFTIPTSENSR